MREVDDDVEGRYLDLEKAFSTQSKKTYRSILEMVKAFKLMTRFPNKIGASTSGDPVHQGNSLRISTTHDIQRDHQQRNAQGGDNIYTGMTRLAMIDFPRFGGDKKHEWLV